MWGAWKDKQFEPKVVLTVKRDMIFRPKGMVRLPRRAGFYLIGILYSFAVAKEYFFVGFCIKKEKGAGRYAMSENFDKKDNRIAVVSILVADRSVSDKVNGFLSEYGELILGRMWIPYKEKGVSVLSVVMDAPVEVTNALTGKLGRLSGVSVKALFGKI